MSTLYTFYLVLFNSCICQIIDTRSKLKIGPKSQATEVPEEAVTTVEDSIVKACNLTWKRYDFFSDPLAPTQNGVLIGRYIDGSPIYVGRGSSNFFKGFTLPARVYVNESTSKYGLYVVAYPNEFLDTTKTAEYLVADSNYDFKWIKSSQGEMEVNGVGWTISRYNASAARVTIKKMDGSEFKQIAASINSLGTIFYDPVIDEITFTGFKSYEALICVPRNIEYEPEFCVHEWKQYDAANNPTGPAVDGFYIGKYHDNSSIYLGRGNDICYAITPARVNIVNKTQIPGIYTSCDGVELLDETESAEYLVKNPKHTYTWFKASSDDVFLNAVKWSYLSDTLIVSRINVVNKRMKSSFMTVGKTFAGIGTWFYNPVTKRTQTVGKGKVEILLCSPKGSTKPVRAPRKGCVHTWKELDFEFDFNVINTDGILAGNYTDGSPIFIGAGYNEDINDIVPARLSINGSLETGVYVCGAANEYLDSEESTSYLAYNDSQIYRWVRTKAKNYVRNQIEMTGLYYTYSISRVNLTNNQNQSFTQIGTNYVGVGTYYFNPVSKTVENVTNSIDFIEVLTCTVKTE